MLENHLDELINNNFSKVIISLGYNSNIILDFLKKVKPKYEKKIDIQVFIDDECIGTKNAILQIRNLLDNKFLLINGDLFYTNYLKSIILQLEKMYCKNFDAIFSARWTNHPKDSDLILLDTNNRILKLYKKLKHNLPNIHPIGLSGISIISSNLLDNHLLDSEETDLIASLLTPENLIRFKFLGIVNNRFIRDIGTIERLNEAKLSKQKENSKPAVFFDRDGTLIENMNYIVSRDQVKLKKDVEKILKFFERKNYFLICVSNTPQISMGLLNLEDIYAIHNEIQNQLNIKGVGIDAYYMCPHHPDSGFEGELSKLKYNCECRKPKSGMIEKALTEFPIDIRNSIVIGDSWRDIKLGKNVGLKTFLVHSKLNKCDEVTPDFSFDTFTEMYNFLAT